MTEEPREFPYEDIIDLPHPTSFRHPRMSPQERAAQFAPFAALGNNFQYVLETLCLKKYND